MNKELVLALKQQAFDKQREVIRDKNKRIVLHVGRRGAKTSTIVLLFIMYALMYEDVRLLFFGVSGESAENAFLPHALKYMKKIDMLEDRDFIFNKTKRIFTFTDTNSTISLKGLDTSYKEMGKVLGGNAFAVCIDEMQDQTQDIEKAILSDIQPILSDHLTKSGMGGGLYLCGTSGDFMGDNFWYRICTTSNHLGWKYYTWLDKENPHMLEAKLIEDSMYKEQYGEDFMELDWYKQQYLNQWIVAGNRMVYQVGERNYLGHPECLTLRPSAIFFTDAIYGLGMDWGFSPDPMAFIVVAYNPKFSNKLFVIREFKKNEMYVSDVDKKIRELDKEYHFTFMVADAGAQAKSHVEDLNNNYGHSIHYADKLGKLAHQNLLNSDLRAGHLLIDPVACPELIKEMTNLIFDPIKLNTQNKREEKAGLSNDLCDSLLYIHHHCRHLWYTPPKKKYVPETPQEVNQELVKQLINRGKHPASVFSGMDFTKAGAVPGRHYGR